jgi:imidazolonepropionase
MGKSLLVRGARQLLTLRGPSGPRRGAALRDLGVIENGAVLVENGIISSVGPARRIENLTSARHSIEIDASGCVVMPGFVDSHTHLVHGPPSLDDYERRIARRARAGVTGDRRDESEDDAGCIDGPVGAVRLSSARRLKAQAIASLHRMAACGTTTVEAKSGHSLDLAGDLNCLRLLAELDRSPLDIVPTIFGSPVPPPEFEGRADAFIDWLSAGLLSQVAQKKLARFACASCGEGAFSYAQALRFLQAASQLGFALRLEAGRRKDLGAIRLALEARAHSVVHMEAMEANEMDNLAKSAVIATLVPGSSFCLGSDRYAPARALIDSGAAVVLATGFCPRSCPNWNMQLVLSLACARLHMTPAEAISAATINAACSLGLGSSIGSLEAGKQADLLVLSVSDYRELPYYFGANHVRTTLKRGVVLSPAKDLTSP